MAQTNVELVEKAWGSYEAGGTAAVLPLLTDDVRWYTFPEAVGASVYVGHEGQLALQREMQEMLDEFELKRVELREAGDRVVVLAEMRGKVRGSETPISQRIGVIYGDFRDGRIGEMRTYQGWPEALEAAGLSA